MGVGHAYTERMLRLGLLFLLLAEGRVVRGLPGVELLLHFRLGHASAGKVLGVAISRLSTQTEMEPLIECGFLLEVRVLYYVLDGFKFRGSKRGADVYWTVFP